MGCAKGVGQCFGNKGVASDMGECNNVPVCSLLMAVSFPGHFIVGDASLRVGGTFARIWDSAHCVIVAHIQTDWIEKAGW